MSDPELSYCSISVNLLILILTRMDNKEILINIYLDLSKDTLDHSILIDKLDV